MRVTEKTQYEVIRHSLERSKARMEHLQHQAATLKKLNQPSDDAVGAVKILSLRTEHMNHEQFQMNGTLAESFLNHTDAALADMLEVLLRAKELSLSQSNTGGGSEDTRLAVAEEMLQLFHQALTIANRRIGERYLFGGYKTQQLPFDQEGAYHGDEGQMMIEIAGGVFLAINVSGREAFYASLGTPGSFDSQTDTNSLDLFDLLDTCRLSLVTGDQSMLRHTLEPLDHVHRHLVALRAKIGSRLSGLRSTQQALERQSLSHAALSSQLEDADMAQVVSDLNKEETVFRSALASSKRLIQPTLLDFLK